MAFDGSTPPARVTPRSDILSGAITVASILLFVGTGSAVLSMGLHSYLAGQKGPDQTLVIALLLNIALILFGWRRHRELGGAQESVEFEQVEA